MGMEGIMRVLSFLFSTCLLDVYFVPYYANPNALVGYSFDPSRSTVTPASGPHTLKFAKIPIPEEIRQYLTDPTQEFVTFEYLDPVHALVSMLHFNPLAADWNNLCFTYEESSVYDDFCNGERVKRIQVWVRA